MNEMAPRIRATPAELLDAVDASRPFDLINALPFPLPIRIMFNFILGGVLQRDAAPVCGFGFTFCAPRA